MVPGDGTAPSSPRCHRGDSRPIWPGFCQENGLLFLTRILRTTRASVHSGNGNTDVLVTRMVPLRGVAPRSTAYESVVLLLNDRGKIGAGA